MCGPALSGAAAVLVVALALALFTRGEEGALQGPGPPPAERPAVAVGCDQRVEPPVRFDHPEAVRLGPLTLYRTGSEDRADVPRPLVLKLPVAVDAGATVTVRASAPAALRSGHRRTGAPAIAYTACPAGEPLFSSDTGTVGPRTGFAGDLTLPEPGCVVLRAFVDGRPVGRTQIPVGVPRCPP
jgi:hypothetical protein